jgi:hypothetical protein
MSSKHFLQALKNMKETKSLDKVLVGSGANYLGEGTHDVTIVAVDSSKVDNDMVTITYGDEQGRQYTDRVFLLSQDKSEFSYGLKQLLSGTIPDQKALEAIINELGSGNSEAYNMLTGMKTRITLGYGKGFRVASTGSGKFVAEDVETKERQTDEFDTLKEAQESAEAKGLRRAFLRVKRIEATHHEANIKSLFDTLSDKQQAASPAGGGGIAGLAAAKKTPSFV